MKKSDFDSQLIADLARKREAKVQIKNRVPVRDGKYVKDISLHRFGFGTQSR